MRAICITGESAQGKTPIVQSLCRKYRLPAIHTDNIYHSDLPVKNIGGKEGVKVNYLRRWLRHNRNDVIVIEGSHIGNEQELEVFKELLGFEEYVMIKLENPDWDSHFIEKHPEEETREVIKDWWGSIFNVQGYKTASSYEDIVNIIKGLGWLK
jgi:hypothetical protein